VDTRVIRELGMEGSDQEPTLPKQDWLAVELREHVDALASATDAGRADENAPQRHVFSGQVEIRFEARNLPPVGVARDIDIEEAEMLLVEHNQAGAGAENRPLEAPHRVLEAIEAHEAHERR
jgi:hypothetical protein